MHTVRFGMQYGKKILAAKFQRENEQNTGNSYIVDEGIGEYISWKDK
ncbi:hypothetical protein [Prevotella sp. P5-64]|nr:hypothetical protein [Prevotella sp. P5-64]